MMKNLKRAIVGGLAVLTLAATSVVAFAASAYQTPAEAAAGVTGKSVEEVTSERQSGKSYGSIAAEAGKLVEFQQAVLDIRKDALNALVADGTLTQDEADAQIEAMKERQAACNGTGTGAGCGMGTGGNGRGQGRGYGRGMGLRNGSCIYQ